MNKTESLGARVTEATFAAVDAAAKSEGISRSEWLEIAIARQLGKRPRLTLAARLSKVERQLAELMGDRTA